MITQTTNLVPIYCPYCGSQKPEERSDSFYCDNCKQQFSIQLVKREDKTFIVLSIGKPKFNANQRLICWLKVQRKTDTKPLLFAYPADKVSKLDLHPSDIIFVNFPPKSNFSEREDVIFAPQPTDIQFVDSDTVELTVPVKLDDLRFADDAVSARIVFGQLEKRMEYGASGESFVRWYHSGATFPVKTTFPSDGASQISIRIDGDLWRRFIPDFELAYSHNEIKKHLPVDQLNEVAIEVSGKFRVIYNWDKTVRLENTDDIVFTNQNLMSLKRAVEESELAKRWKIVRKQIRELLALKRILSVSQVQEILDANNYNAPVEDVMKSLSNSKDYNDDFFEHVKSLAGESPAYFTERGYFFKVGRYTVWEIPQRGRASWVFIGEPNEVVTKLGDFEKMEILEAKDKLPESVAFFKGRAIHRTEDGWKEALGELLK
jgi:hypothetical protein